MPPKPSFAALAAILLGLLAALPARADDRATLRVTVRVVESCEIRVPDWVWEHVLKDKAKEAISHRCRGRGPARIDFDPPGPPPWVDGPPSNRGPPGLTDGGPPGLADGGPPGRAKEGKNPTGGRAADRSAPGSVRVTITY
jgi:hypothetical protein